MNTPEQTMKKVVCLNPEGGNEELAQFSLPPHLHKGAKGVCEWRQDAGVLDGCWKVSMFIICIIKTAIRNLPLQFYIS